MNKILRRRKAILLTILSVIGLFGANIATAQTNVEVYGQNRIQYRLFKWRYFDTKHFRIYHYDRAGRELARYVAEQIENDITVVEQKIGGRFPHRFNIVLYNTYDEYKQTNIGRKYDSQLQNNPAGTLDIVGDKLVVYFNGVHADLRRQTRAGMSRVIMERMVFGDNVKEMVKNAVLLNLPEWTVYGFISYLVDGWDTKTNSDWKNLIEANQDKGFYEISEMEPELAGKAFWKYISVNYGDNTVKNLVYTMQVKSSLNQAIKMTLGKDVKEVYDSVITYYEGVYVQEEKGRTSPDSSTALININVPDDGTEIRNIKVAPRGNDVAYVAWKDGEYKVYLQKTKNSQSRAAILKGGKLDYGAEPDPNYPLIAWSNTGYKLAILYKEKRQVKLRIFNSLKVRVENYDIPENRFDRVLGMTFMEDDDKMVFSAVKRSQTDLYEFAIRGKRMTNITDDSWDDIAPWYVSGGSRKGILFLSNRTAPNLEVEKVVNELPNGPMNVFFYNTVTKRKELIRMSDIKEGEITQPIQYGSDNYAYLYDKNGIKNQYIVMMTRGANNKDSAYAVPITNYSRNIMEHQYNPASNQVAEVIQVGDKYKVFYKKLQIPGKNVEPTDPQPTILSNLEAAKSDKELGEKELSDNEPILKSGNIFKSEFSDEEESAKAPADEVVTEEPEADDEQVDEEILKDEGLDANGVDSTYLKMRPKRYRLSFQPDFFSVRLDNTVLFTRYQAYNGGQYTNPNLGGMLTVSLDDKLEDYRITGGFRLPINFRGLNYFVQYENYRRRLDWGVLYLRTENSDFYDVQYVDTSGRPVAQRTQYGKTVTSLVQGTASYPFNKFESVRFHLGLRQDVFRFKSLDYLSLAVDPEDNVKYWLTGRAEYVFDNTDNPVINIYNGARLKFFGEYMYRLNNNGGGIYNIGGDLRYYKKIYKNFIFAIRGAAAYSGGRNKILYRVGGVDNWIGAQYNNNAQLKQGETYAFQALSTNMRGYQQNSFNGGSYAVVNTELRLPVLTTFLKKPIQSAILRNLQVVAFADLGTAWNGFWPTLENIQKNILVVDPQTPFDPTVSFTVEDQSSGLGFGYGLGARTQLFGYFVRLDYGANIDDGFKKGIVYFSIGTDF